MFLIEVRQEISNFDSLVDVHELELAINRVHFLVLSDSVSYNIYVPTILEITIRPFDSCQKGVLLFTPVNLLVQPSCLKGLILQC